ncbi:MAG: carbohydrate-binding domain-containing protein [Flexilinea sp.]|nr:carbohydrate-binding domain-containing protein [Flexilinea sp.]
MSTDKHIDRICIIITLIALLVTVLFMNGEKLGIERIVDADAEKYSDLDQFTANDQNGEWDTTGATVITLNGESASVSGNGAYVNNGSVVITNAGKYLLSGTLTDGNISVDAYISSKVWLLLDGVNITSSDNAAIRVEEADKVFLTLAEGSENFLSTGETFSDTAIADGTNGAIYAHDDLTINGTGALTIVSGYKHGIDANDDLIITGGTINITAPLDGLHANDSLRIMNADLTIDAGDDGLMVAKENGYLHIESGTINIKADGDAIHTAGDITIDSGSIALSAGDDGIHSDTNVLINDGVLLISECYEGIEAVTIDIAGGDITIYPSDDGLNANGGSDMFGMPGGFGPGALGQNTETATPTPTVETQEDDSTWVRISGGNLTIINENARDADGIDSNGDLIITGGTIRVSLPGGGTNNAIDYGSESGGKATISGGNLVAAGGSMMSENFDESSEQPVIMYNLTETVEGGTEVLVLDAEGNEILSYTPPQSFNSIFLSCPEMKVGETYTVIIGETEEELTMDSDAITLGSAGMGSFGGGFFRGGGGGRGGRSRDWETATVTPDGSTTDSTAEPGEMPKGGGFPGGPGGMMPPDGQMPTFDGTEMPEFDGTIMPQDGGFPGGPGGMGFDQRQTAEEEEETAAVSTAKSLSEFSPETWILLGTSFATILAAILFALKFKRF